VATARFWGVERVLVQGDGRWSVRGWPGWAELASGDGEAEPEPDGRRLAVRAHGDAVAVLDGDARTDLAPPPDAGPLRALAWGSDGGLLLEMGRDPMDPPFGAGPTLLPVPETGCSAQPFGSYPDEGMTLWRLPTDGGSPTRLAVADGASRIARPVGLRGGRATFELWRLPLYGRTYTWRILRHEPSETGAGAVGDLLPGVPGATAGLAPSPDGQRLAFLHSRIEPLTAVQFHLALVGAEPDAAVEHPLPHGMRLTGRPPVWAPDGAALAVTAFDGIRVGIVVVEPGRATWRWLGPTDGYYERVALAPGGTEALASWQSPSSATRLCRVSADGRAALPGIEDAAPETATRFDLVRWRVDGFDLEGVLATPRQGSGPWPLVVDLHGGPINGLRFGQQPQLERWAGAGFAAFAPEHRESGIAGEEAMMSALRCLDDPPGLSAARDVLAGVEEVVRRGAADPQRLYVRRITRC
jgi:dipeptidyl aminopeptidase/acylaminoacyl peptidase